MEEIDEDNLVPESEIREEEIVDDDGDDVDAKPDRSQRFPFSLK